MRALLLLFLALVSIDSHGQISQRAAPEPAGRYQLFQGNYEFVNIKGEVYWNRALFKIDTVTGALFVCEGKQVDGKYLSSPQPGKMVQRHYCKPFEEETAIPQR